MLEILGRFHPLVLHLPIGILTLAYILEMYMTYKKDHQPEVQSFILLMAAISSTVAIATGLLLIRGGDYGGALVENHKWVAIALGLISWALFFVQKAGKRKPYILTLVSSAVMLGVTGHLGGSITHGEDFLFKSNDLPVRPVVEEAVLFSDIIHPIFEDKCISCHNPTKLKGEFNMTSREKLLEGGVNGEVIFVDNLLQSPLIKRVHLPMALEEHMPPEGKEQLSNDELNLLEWWVETGADFEKLAVETVGFEEHSEVAKKFLAPPKLEIFDKVESPDSLALVRLNSQGIKLYPRNSGSSAIYVNLSNKKNLKPHHLKSLRKIKNNISHLNLAGSDFTDGQVKLLKGFKHIQKLELQNTAITSGAINALPDYDFLQTLNLYNTRVDSTAIDKILAFPQLKTLYLWRTDFTDEDVIKLKSEKPRLNVVYEVNKKIFKDAALRPPVINTDQDMFDDTLLVSLDLNFKGAEIYYQIDEGDTLRYAEPFLIENTTKVSAYARKEGWGPSEANEKTFIKSGKKIADLKLHNKPHKRYANFAQKALANNKLGSELFRDGEWVGYEGTHGRLTAMLEKSSEITHVTIGALESTGSYIFYPKSIKVSVSSDGKKFTQVANEEYEMVSGPSSLGRKSLVVPFEAVETRWVKIDVLSHLENPEWHAAPGAKNWIFIDEIIIN